MDVPKRGEERGEDGEAREEGGEMVEVEEGFMKSLLWERDLVQSFLVTFFG